MSLETWIAFCMTEAVLCLTPGPAVLLVVSTAVGRGLRPSLGAASGILAANALYFALSATGVAAAIATSRELFAVLKWAGAAYLVWIGAQMLLRPAAPRTAREEPPAATRAFLRGFVVQGANPKSLVFFIAFLPQFIDPAQPIPRQLLILGLSSVAIELAALSGYAHAAVGARRVAGHRIARALERIGGGLLVAAGARLATARPD